MIQELIKRTNSEDFYQNSDLKLESYNYDATTRVFNLILSVNQISYDHYIEYEEWRIACRNTEKMQGFCYELMMPYVKMRILEKHPLLWLYQKDELECEIQGEPNNINKFVFDLVKLIEEETGNWISTSDILWNFQSYIFKIKNTIRIPAPLEKGIHNICNNQNLIFKISNYKTGEEKGYSHKPNAKLLMFGNEDVSPYTFNLGQHYIIAEGFSAERIK